MRTRLKVLYPVPVADDKDRQIAECLAFGMTWAATAAHLGCHIKTIEQRKSKKKEFYERVDAEVKALISMTVSKKIQDIEAKADAKRRLNEKAYRVHEKVIDAALGDPEESCQACGRAYGVEPDTLHLTAAREMLDRTEGKSLDRKAILSRHEETVTHQVSEDTIKRLTAFMNNNRALLPEAITVEPS